MREFNSKDLDALEFERVRSGLSSGVGGIFLKKIAALPDADILCCEFNERGFNIKFDMDYQVSLEAIDEFSIDELKNIAEILLRLVW